MQGKTVAENSTIRWPSDDYSMTIRWLFDDVIIYSMTEAEIVNKNSELRGSIFAGGV